MNQPIQPFDPATVREALTHAVLPSLVPTLYQLTGDERWLSDRYASALPRGFDEQPDGGYPDDVQEEIRECAVDALIAWSAGRAPAVPQPEPEVTRILMAHALGEDVPAASVEMLAEQIGIAPFRPAAIGSSESSGEFSALVIGAGISGLIAAHDLARTGVEVTVLEKNAEVGGSWWENRYPGARADVPSNLYSFSFAGRGWPEHFAQRDDILAYILDTVEEMGIRERIRFGTEATSLRWDEDEQLWHVTVLTSAGEEELTANVVVTAVGLHNRPAIPDFAGAAQFEGQIFHSARWPEDEDLTGRRVAVVGSGASAMQVVAAIVDDVEHLDVFQRSPHWIAPNPYYFQPMGDSPTWLVENAPFYRSWYRLRLFYAYTERHLPALRVDPEWDQSLGSINRMSEALRRMYMDYMRAQLGNRDDLVAKSTPDFPVFGRRILLDNGWFRALLRDDVDLVDAAIEKFEPSGIRTVDGVLHPLDVVVLCTGFHQQRMLHPLDITGRGGQTIHSAWDDDDPRAFLGMTAPGFPNLFFLYGPNTTPPGGSWIGIAELQSRYITTLVTEMARHGIGAVEVTAESFKRYNRELDEGIAGTVYAQQQAHSYYKNRAGRVVTNMPWSVLGYWERARHPALEDYRVTPARATVGTR
jgi:4-hydroxyacetophenone monooxygenase